MQRALRLPQWALLGCLTLSMTSCYSVQTKYVRQPFILQPELVQPVAPQTPVKGALVADYVVQLLGLIEQMNVDRAAVQEAVMVHNRTATKPSK